MLKTDPRAAKSQQDDETNAGKTTYASGLRSEAAIIILSGPPNRPSEDLPWHSTHEISGL